MSAVGDNLKTFRKIYFRVKTLAYDVTLCQQQRVLAYNSGSITHSSICRWKSRVHITSNWAKAHFLARKIRNFDSYVMGRNKRWTRFLNTCTQKHVTNNSLRLCKLTYGQIVFRVLFKLAHFKLFYYNRNWIILLWYSIS